MQTVLQIQIQISCPTEFSTLTCPKEIRVNRCWCQIRQKVRFPSGNDLHLYPCAPNCALAFPCNKTTWKIGLILLVALSHHTLAFSLNPLSLWRSLTLYSAKGRFIQNDNSPDIWTMYQIIYQRSKREKCGECCDSDGTKL